MRTMRALIIILMDLMAFTLPAAAQENAPETFELTESQISENGYAQVDYPQGWVVDTSDAWLVEIANSEDALATSFGDPVANGDVNILAGIFPLGYLIESLEIEVEADAAVVEIAQAIIDQALELNSETPPSTFGEPEATSVADRRAATFSLGVEGVFGGRFWLVSLEPGVFSAVQLITADGETQQWEPLALAVLESVQYSEALEIPELTESTTSQNGKVTFNYPAGWETIYESYDDTSAIVGSSIAALGNTLGDEIDAGEVTVLVMGNTASELGELFEIEGDVTAKAVARKLVEVTKQEDHEDWVVFEEDAALSFSDLPAALITVSGPTFVGRTWIMEIEPGIFAGVSLLTHPDEADSWTPLALAIAETITYEE